MQAVTLTFDLEEFDIPEEYGQFISFRNIMQRMASLC
ncbi:hypothetical protein QE357_005170 [Siphonobacter sp. BAB-5404]|nr:hypothetical protein [Siphonobacter sp. SORGH_AS_1065]MDR6198058.1 hypothetical protein [Siphonobacter sp. SORGH_AS_0500]